MRIALLLILLTLAGCSEASPRQSALLLRFAGGSLCSGTAVSDDVLLGAEHCFKDDRLVSIDGTPAYAMKIERDGNDHVLVRVNRQFKHWTRIGRNPSVGTHIKFWGCGFGLPFAYREAYVSLVFQDAILYDGMSGPGDSGAGLFAGGAVVGVVTGYKVQRLDGGGAFSFLWTKPMKWKSSQLVEMGLK